MWSLKVFGLIALLVVGALAFEDIDAEERIINSTPASLGQFGYVVQLAINRPPRPSQFCVGALINSRIVLTTARCVVNRIANLGEIVVLSGSVNNSRGALTPISKILIHRGFNATSIQNDIALVRTAQPIQFSQNVWAVQLPTALTPPKTKVVNAGWGSTTTQFRASTITMIQRFRGGETVDFNECKSLLDVRNTHFIHPNTFCSTLTTCFHDGGNPLVDETSKRLVGLTSMNHELKWQGRCLGPDLNISIFHHLRWIQWAIANSV